MQINGKTIDEINQLISEAVEEESAEREKYFAKQWELLKEEIAKQHEQDMIRQHDDMEFGRLDMESFVKW